MLALFTAACGGGATDVPGGADLSSGDRHLNLVAYATPKPGFDLVVPGFRDTADGRGVGFSQSYGASGDQSRKVARGLPADVVALSVQPDVTRLVTAGVVDADWEQRAPHRSVPFGSVVALVVRAGNPKNIRDWPDLLRPDVTVVTPNPGSSGAAKWNLLAPYAAASDGGARPQAGLDRLRALIRDHVRVQPKSGREATTAFEQGEGDVLITSENEAIMLSRHNASARPGRRTDYVIPPQTVRIDNPVAVVNTGTDPAAARAFVDYLFTPAAQHLWARAGFRPVDPEVAAATAGDFPGPIERAWTVDELGGWPRIDTELFGPAGAVTAIYAEEAGR